MTGIASAIAVGASAAIGAGTQVYGAAKSAKAQKNALQQQGSTSQGDYAVNQGLYQPYVDSGTNALWHPKSHPLIHHQQIHPFH